MKPRSACSAIWEFCWRLPALAVLLVPFFAPVLLSAQDLGAGQFQILGTSLDISPETQAVPVGVPTLVHTALPSATGAALPADLVVLGELSGPGITGTISLSTTPNSDFQVPGQAVKGEYVLSDIRLVEGSSVLAYALHRTAVITVTDVLITQITSRPLTYQEMIDQGIVVSKQDFSAYNFSFSMVLDSKTVTFDVPIVFSPNGPPVLPKIPTQSGTPPGGEFFRPPQINTIDLLGNISAPKVSNPDGEGSIPLRIPTLLLIPGDVAFLNQFFSVSILVQNGAPAGSNLVLQNVTATPRFPGNLQVKSSTPAVNLGDPVPLRDPGPDGILGTADDVTFLVGQAKGNADFVVEGLRSGTYDVPIDVNATIAGLPTGPLAVSAQAHGTILVRHPSFFVTLDHPDTIRAGESYSVNATVTNTSGTVANQVQIALDKTFISGTELVGDAVVLLGNIDPHQNAVATFQFKAARTGRVQATAVFSDGSLSGAIQLQTGIGELGIAVSPDTLILPKEIDALPQDDLVTPARELLGLGWSLAKSPAGTTDPSLPPVGEQAVRWRVQDLALAARHQKLGESPDLALAEWILEWLNSDPGSQATTFDLLRRESAKGAALAAGVGRQLSTMLSATTPEAFSDRVFQNLSDLPHTSVTLSEGSDPAHRTARLSITAFGGAAQTAFASGEDAYVRGVPNAEIFSITASGAVYEQAWIGGADAQTYQLQILGQSSGSVDLTLDFPGPNGSLIRATFAGVGVHESSIAMVSFVPGQLPASLTLQGDGPGVAGSISQIPAPPLTALAAYQDLDADPLGRAISILFNRTLQPGPASDASNFRVYATHEDSVQIAKPQPSDPRLVIIGVENHPSPYLDWGLEIHGLTGGGGIALDPSPQVEAITISDHSPGLHLARRERSPRRST